MRRNTVKVKAIDLVKLRVQQATLAASAALALIALLLLIRP